MGKSNRTVIAYYVSAHGYGHGVRSCDIIRALNSLYPRLKIEVVSTLPPRFLFSRINGHQNSIRSNSFDVGMVQKDSIRIDVTASLNRVTQLYDAAENLIAGEISYLKDNCIDLVIVDIPSIPLEAAARAGVPCIAVGNFGWDWIYSEFIARDPRWASIAESIRKSYSKADLLLRLPFSEPMNAFPVIEDIPLVASSGRCRREEVARLLNCDTGKKWILISFTSLGWKEEALDRVAKIVDYEFFTVLPLEFHRSNIHAVRREQVPFSDVIASVDAVISKPGFGIISECIVNCKPLIYADRSDFAEYCILEASIQRYLKYVHIPTASLYRGELKPSLDLIWDRPEATEILERGGDSIAARRIARLAGEHL